jgi:hypothetical protein
MGRTRPVDSMTLNLWSKVSIASTDGLLGLALIACKPGTGFVWLDHEQVLERTYQAVGDGRGDRLKISWPVPSVSPTMRVIRNSAGSSTRFS